eukprot:1179120-Prorocentrum_minimum.AAC.3
MAPMVDELENGPKGCAPTCRGPTHPQAQTRKPVGSDPETCRLRPGNPSAQTRKPVGSDPETRRLRPENPSAQTLKPVGSDPDTRGRRPRHPRAQDPDARRRRSGRLCMQGTHRPHVGLLAPAVQARPALGGAGDAREGAGHARHNVPRGVLRPHLHHLRKRPSSPSTPSYNATKPTRRRLPVTSVTARCDG